MTTQRKLNTSHFYMISRLKKKKNLSQTKYFHMTSCYVLYSTSSFFKLLLRTCCTNKVYRYYYFLQVIWGAIGVKAVFVYPRVFLQAI